MRRFNNVSDIVAVNWNDLVGASENHVDLFEQVVRDVKEAISEAAAQVASAAAVETVAARELERIRYQAQLWQRRAIRAIESGDDALAQRTLARKHEHQKRAAVLEQQLEAARLATIAQTRQLDLLKFRLAEARRFLERSP